MVHHYILRCLVPRLAEFCCDHDLFALLASQSAQETAESRFTARIRRSCIEIANPKPEGMLQETERLRFRGNLGSHESPRSSNPNESTTEGYLILLRGHILATAAEPDREVPFHFHRSILT